MAARRIGGFVCLAALLAASPAHAAPPVPNKGDTAWMLISTALVLLMSVPGLALFYGGLVRTKNMLSVLTQVFLIVSVAALIWVSFGYSLAFTEGGPLIGGFGKVFLRGVTADSTAGTFSAGVVIPEFTYIAFQMTFACITPALIIGALAERIRFTPLMLFTVLWMVVVYLPIAHMVWYWDGPDAFIAAAAKGHAGLDAANGRAGLLFAAGALDFAGGTVVHINSGIAGLMGALILGPRVGFGRESMAPHSLTMTMIGASLLWVGWFGFNAGSNLEANGVAAVALLNTFVASAAGAVSWAVVEQLHSGKPSMLGGVSGAIAGLVAVTPASGFAGPMGSIVLGLAVSPICWWFVTRVKLWLRYDDALDAFGIHCVGGIVGALATAFLADPRLGGQGVADYLAKPGSIAFTYPGIGPQLIAQAKAVGVTLAWSGSVSALLLVAIKRTIGLRPAIEAEREGLDLTEHGERAYNY